VPVDDQPGSPRHPWSLLSLLAKPADLVVAKLDIDNSPLELSLVNQLLANASISGLVDVLLWEQHWASATRASRVGCTTRKEVCVHPHGFHIGSRKDRRMRRNPTVALSEVYRNFVRLREELGILAHAWV